MLPRQPMTPSPSYIIGKIPSSYEGAEPAW
jgi:hypothetical protein